MGQPAFGLTDHGNMSGTIQGYLAAKKAGIQFFPGMEGYLTVDPIVEPKKGDPPLDRFHIGFLALNFEGYQELSKLTTLSHTRPRFNRFPRFDLNDLAAAETENIAVTTGCYFGLVQQTLVTKGEQAAKRIIEMYARWFPNTFVEVQNHQIDHSMQERSKKLQYVLDEEIVEAMIEIADEVGLPVLATQDSHYCDFKQKPAHELMKRMVYRGGEDRVDEFPGDSFHLATTEWVKSHYLDDEWERVEEGAQTLLDLHDLELPALDSYKPHVPTVKRKPQVWLEKQCWKMLDYFDSEGFLVKPLKGGGR